MDDLGGAPPIETGDTPSATPSAPGAAEQPQADLSDQNVLANLMAVNGHEIILASLVLEKTQDPTVREMAQMIMDDHRAAMDQGKQLQERLGLQPIDDEQAGKMKTVMLTDHMNQLATLSGPELDRKFVDLMAEGHKNAIEQIDGTLLEKAKAPELKAMMVGLRPKLQHHQEMAEQLQKRMKS
jgi:putative membrane protein